MRPHQAGYTPPIKMVAKRGPSCFLKRSAHRGVLSQQARAIVGTRAVSDSDLRDVFVALGVPTKYVEAQIRFYRSERYSSIAQALDTRSATVTAFPSEGMSAVGYLCHYCGQPAEHIDHVWPRSRGGDDHPNNLVRACQSCNSRKGTRSLFTMPCACGRQLDPGDLDTATGTAFYHCRCGRAWQHAWTLQQVTLAA